MNKIVPCEPTEEMIKAGLDAEDNYSEKIVWTEFDNTEALEFAYKAMLSAAPESDHIIASRAEWQAAMESQWISVDDRLPDTDQTALTYDKDCKEIRTTWFADWRDIKNFQWLSHWMPLPQPPKEKL
jgi:hypothetical protein